MKTRRNRIIGCLLLATVVWLLGGPVLGVGSSENLRALTKSEMALIMGSDIKDARCENMCENRGSSQQDCTGVGSCSTDDAYECNLAYLSGVTGSVTVNRCATDTDASEKDCSEQGDPEICGYLYICECVYKDLTWKCDVLEQGEDPIVENCREL